MFQLTKIILVNFKSFRGEHQITLPSASGVYYLTGKNMVNPRLGANDVGKSTILDALHWAIFGRTARGLKAGEVVAWGAKNASVTVYVAIGGKRAKITRSQAPNSLTLDDTPVSQDQITKFVRMNEAAFDYAVMMPQFGTSFFDLKPADKLALFSEIMGLDFWLDKAEAATKLASEIEAQKAKCLIKQANLEGHHAALEAEQRDLGIRSQTFQLEIREKVQKTRDELESLLRERSFIQRRREQSIAALEGAKKRLAKISRKCESCGQPLPEGNDHAGLRRNINDFELDARQLERKLAELSPCVTRLGEELASEPRRVNPYAQLQQAKAVQLSKLETDLACLSTHIAHLEREHAAISFWIAGFKRIRLMIVDETLRQLEVEVNNNLAALGLADWSVEFDVERENKSGGTTKGFAVSIKAPNRAEATKYEAWGGGVTQRLRMAGDLGLANLIMEQAGLTNTIEFYDEPSQHLSQEGLLDLAQLLADRAEQTDKVIILVDHHAIEFGGFADTITVVKDEMGSKIAI